MTRFYQDLIPHDPDWTQWTMAHVLRRQAAENGDGIFLIAPEEDEAQWTYAEALEDAERVGGGLRASGVQPGDRVIIMARNSSRFVMTWLGTAMADIVQAPVNTAYEGDFLRHQVTLVDAEWVVCDDAFADRFIAIARQIPKVRKFWVIDHGDLDGALERLRAAGWEASPWSDLQQAQRWLGPEPDARSLTSIFFGRVPAFAIPRYIRFVDKLPRTPSEKIQRAVLRDEAATATDIHDRVAAPRSDDAAARAR